MNKKVNKTKKTYDDKEDLEIREVAYYKKTSQGILFIILIFIFIFTLTNSLMYIFKFNNRFQNEAEIIEINKNNINLLIVNNGIIDKTTTENDFTDDKKFKIVSSDTLEFKNHNTKNNSIKFDVKYEINKNDFKLNTISTNKSELLVRFAYSYDNKNWTYIKNVISTKDSNIIPLMGDYYDIAGIKDSLNIVTNFEITNKAKESKKMYWKSETIIQNNDDTFDKRIEANFKIMYKDSILDN